MNRVVVVGLVLAVVLASVSGSAHARAANVDFVCSARSDVDDADVVVTWVGDVVRPIRWGRPVLRIDVAVASRSSGSAVCDPDAWIEIRQISPSRRLVESGPAVVVEGRTGRIVHRLEWSIEGGIGVVDAGTYEIVFTTGVARTAGAETDDRNVAGSAPVSSAVTVARWPIPKKLRVPSSARPSAIPEQGSSSDVDVIVVRSR